MSHIDRRHREKEETRLKILDAAREIAARENWQSVTIRKIADKIEYTPPIVYEYFENKEELFKELVYSGFEILHKQYQEVRETETDPRKLMTKIALINLNFALDHKELFQLMFSLERPTPNESMKYNMTLMESTIREISNSDDATVKEQLFGFLCMSHGAITFIMQTEWNTSPLGTIDFRSLYTNIIERYINSL
jgi:AcrR family transcriptional regulator